MSKDGLKPIGEIVKDALSGMAGAVQALRATPRPSQRHFTQADQVNQLVSASEADPDRGFMARTMALCSPALPLRVDNEGVGSIKPSVLLDFEYCWRG